jgi:hypothetical protein
MTTPNFELLKDAYEIVDGIPAENFYLNQWRMRDEGLSCGTIACAAGWLTLHPKFQALGLEYGKTANDSTQIKYRGVIHMSALAQFFGISVSDAEGIFGVVSSFQPVRSHKALFLRRLYNFLREHGQLKGQIERRAQQQAVVQRALMP